MDHHHHPHLPMELHALTLNCWGLKYSLSKLRSDRLAEIGRRLAALEPAPHIVSLQECWSEEDYHAIRRETRALLPYAKFYHAGAFGAGLAVLSRWPIEESSMLQFPLSGRPTAFFRGDWYVGKGVACATIRFGPGPRHVIQVLNTHLHATYGGGQDTYACHRLAQAWEMSKIARAAVDRGFLVLAMGDFNMTPMSLPYRLLVAHAPVRDSFRLLHPDSSLGPLLGPNRAVPCPSVNLSENGVTSNSLLNTWAWTREQRRQLVGPDKMMIPGLTPPDAVDDRAKRIDYVFAGYAASTSTSSTAAPEVWTLRDASVGMVGRHPVLDVSLSDHFSVEVTLRLTSRYSSGRHRSRPAAAAAATLGISSAATEDTVTVDDSAVHSGAFLQTNGSPTPSEFRPEDDDDGNGDLRRSLEVGLADPQYDFTSPAYDQVLAVIRHYISRELGQRRWRTAHWVASLVVAAGCIVAACFSPQNYVAVILMLICSLVTLYGTINGLLALLFFGSELRALREFEWEIMNAKAAATTATAKARTIRSRLVMEKEMN